MGTRKNRKSKKSNKGFRKTRSKKGGGEKCLEACRICNNGKYDDPTKKCKEEGFNNKKKLHSHFHPDRNFNCRDKATKLSKTIPSEESEFRKEQRNIRYDNNKKSNARKNLEIKDFLIKQVKRYV